MHEPTPAHLLNRPPSEEDRDFLDRYTPDRFTHPSLAVDIVLVTVQDGRIRVLLIRREEPPFRDLWSLPGGFLRVEADKSLLDAAARVLDEKARCKGVWLEQLATFGDRGRDPRDRVISVAYMALIDIDRYHDASTSAPSHLTADVECAPYEGDVAAQLEPAPVTLRAPSGEQLDLAFDHEHIVATAVHRLRGKLDYAPVGYQLLPDEFTLRQLQDVHEAILGRSLNKDSFRRRMLLSEDLVSLNRTEQSVGHRPAKLYRFRAS